MNELEFKSPSALLRLAIADAKALQRDPSGRYKLDMRVWRAKQGETCSVCLAGAVMTRTLQLPESGMVDTEEGLSDSADYKLLSGNSPTTLQLLAVNYLRQGYIVGALRKLWRLMSPQQLELPIMKDLPSSLTLTRRQHAWAGCPAGIAMAALRVSTLGGAVNEEFFEAQEQLADELEKAGL